MKKRKKFFKTIIVFIILLFSTTILPSPAEANCPGDLSKTTSWDKASEIFGNMDAKLVSTVGNAGVSADLKSDPPSFSFPYSYKGKDYNTVFKLATYRESATTTEWFFVSECNKNLYILDSNLAGAEFVELRFGTPGGFGGKIADLWYDGNSMWEYLYANKEKFQSDLPDTGGYLEVAAKSGLEEAVSWAIERASEMMEYGMALAKSFVNAVIIITPEDFGGNTGISSAWAAVRNLCNILFILGVLIIALANVFRLDIEKYDIRILLPKLIIAMILINLSFLMSRAIIDLSNAMSESFIHMNVNVAGFDRSDIAKNIVEPLKKNNIESGLSAVGIMGSSIGIFLLILVILFIGFVAGLYIMILLLVRVIMIWFLVIISPIVFLFSVLPFTQGLTKSWWSEFSKYVFMGPVIALVLSIGERVAIYYGSAAYTSHWLTPFFCIGILFAAGVIPTMLGGKAMGAVAGRLQGFGKWGWEQTGGRYAKSFGKITGDRAQRIADTRVGSALGRIAPGRFAPEYAAARGKRVEDLKKSFSLMSLHEQRDRLNSSRNPEEREALIKSLAEAGEWDSTDREQMVSLSSSLRTDPQNAAGILKEVTKKNPSVLDNIYMQDLIHGPGGLLERKLISESYENAASRIKTMSPENQIQFDHNEYKRLSNAAMENLTLTKESLDKTIDPRIYEKMLAPNAGDHKTFVHTLRVAANNRKVALDTAVNAGRMSQAEANDQITKYIRAQAASGSDRFKTMSRDSQTAVVEKYILEERGNQTPPI